MKSQRVKLVAIVLVVVAGAVSAAVLLSGFGESPSPEGTWLAWDRWEGSGDDHRLAGVDGVNLDDAGTGPVALAKTGSEPALSKEALVWSNELSDDSTLIYRCALAGGKAVSVDPRDEYQKMPAAAGDWMVWLEHSEMKVKGGALSIDRLVAYDLVRGERRVLVEPVIDVQALSLSGERVVWIEDRAVGLDGLYDVHSYDLTTGEESILRTYENDPIPKEAHVSGRWALWQEYHEWTDAREWWVSVAAYDFSGRKLRHLPKDATTAVSGDWVVCRHDREVSLLNLVSGERREVASDAADFSYAQVHLPWVAWLELDLRRDGDGSVIRAVNIDTGEQRRFETPVSQAEGIGLTITNE